MKFSNSPPEEPEVNLTSLIDVVLLLIIFFMVTTSFVKETAIKIELPKADNEVLQENDDDALVVSISATGKFMLNGRALANSDPRTLNIGIAKIIGDRTDIPVVIQADAKASHQSVVTAMDVVARAGLTKMRVATVSGE